MTEGNVYDHKTGRQIGGNGGNGNVTEYRLNRIDERLSSLESDTKDLTKLATTIKTRMDMLLWGVGIVIAVGLAVMHLYIRSLSGG